ncbi:hypothetical protein Cus16_3189 [Curtobacterium sp. ER1/6]|nr:hypothetical protein Cus16_3189 [Curtobacterium sp. ER1/6]
MPRSAAHPGEPVRRGGDPRTLDVHARRRTGGVQLAVGVDGQRLAGVEQGAHAALATVVAVVGPDDAGDELPDAARAVAEQGDPLPRQVVVEVEERREADPERRRVRVTGLLVVGEAHRELGLVEGHADVLRELPVRLERHLRERLVVHEPRDVLVRRAALRGQVVPGPDEGVDVGAHRQPAVDECGRPVVRPPEVVDVGGEDARGRFDLDEVRVGGHQDRGGAGALGGLGGGVDVVARDVRRDDEHALVRRAGDDAEGELHGGGPAVAGLLQLDHADVVRQAEQPVHVDAGGLRLVDAGLGREEHRADALDAVAVDDLLRGGGTHRDDVLVGGGHAEGVLSDADVVLGRVDAEALGQVVELEHVVAGRDRDVVDADAAHAAPPAGLAPRRSMATCAAMSSPGLVCAASRDSSPQSTVAAHRAARRRALAPGSRSSRQPRRTRASSTTGRSPPLPLPTVPTMRCGSAVEKYRSSPRASA